MNHTLSGNMLADTFFNTFVRCRNTNNIFSVVVLLWIELKVSWIFTIISGVVYAVYIITNICRWAHHDSPLAASHRWPSPWRSPPCFQTGPVRAPPLQTSRNHTHNKQKHYRSPVSSCQGCIPPHNVFDFWYMITYYYILYYCNTILLMLYIHQFRNSTFLVCNN